MTIQVLDGNGDLVTISTIADLLAVVGTEATLAAVLAKLSADPSTNTKLDAVITAIEAIPAGGDASAANQDEQTAALASILAKLIPAPATEAGQAVLAGYLDGVEGALAALLAKVIAAPATEAKQDTLIGFVDGIETAIAATNTKLDTLHADVDGLEGLTGGLTETAPASDTASSGLNGRLQRIAQNLTTMIGTKVTAVAALGAGGAGLIGWLSQIWDRLNSGIALIAGENHIGSVGGNTVYLDVTLSLDTSAYAAGDVLADTQVINGAMRVNAGTGMLQSITVIDQDDQKAQIKLLLLSTNVSLGTENVAPSITDTDAVQIMGAPITFETVDYTDLGGVSIAGKDNLGRVVKAGAGSTSLYIGALNGSGAPTYSAAGIKLRLGFLQD